MLLCVLFLLSNVLFFCFLLCRKQKTSRCSECPVFVRRRFSGAGDPSVAGTHWLVLQRVAAQVWASSLPWSQPTCRSISTMGGHNMLVCTALAHYGKNKWEAVPSSAALSVLQSVNSTFIVSHLPSRCWLFAYWLVCNENTPMHLTWELHCHGKAVLGMYFELSTCGSCTEVGTEKGLWPKRHKFICQHFVLDRVFLQIQYMGSVVDSPPVGSSIT